MGNQYIDFYDVLKDNLDSYDGKYDEFIDYGPRIYKLLIDILAEQDISANARLKTCVALAYFVAPNDIIPEEIHGPHGYVDDIYLCSYVIDEIANEMGYEYLQMLWAGEEKVEDVIDECYSKSAALLEDKTDDVLAYVGLK